MRYEQKSRSRLSAISRDLIEIPTTWTSPKIVQSNHDRARLHRWIKLCSTQFRGHRKFIVVELTLSMENHSRSNRTTISGQAWSIQTIIVIQYGWNLELIKTSHWIFHRKFERADSASCCDELIIVVKNTYIRLQFNAPDCYCSKLNDFIAYEISRLYQRGSGWLDIDSILYKPKQCAKKNKH